MGGFKRGWIWSGLLALGLTPAALAQEVEPPTGTLPPVIVEPPTAPPVEATDLPATDATGPASGRPTDAPYEPFDLPESYPSLSQQRFSELSGALRAERSLFDEPTFTTIIDQQELTERAPLSVGDALQREVGVLIQSTGRGQASPFIRGLTGQQVLILVDGIRLSNATFRAGPNQYLNTVDPGQIERIEVIRGPASVLYGSDAIGGVVNIVTKSPEFIGSDYLSGGTIQRFSSADTGYYGRLGVEGWVGNNGVLGGASYGNFNDLDRGGDLGIQPDTSFNQYNGDLKFTHAVDRFNRLTVALQHFVQQDVHRTDRFPQNRLTLFDPQQRDLAYVRMEGLVEGAFYDSYSLTGSFAYTREDRLDRNPRTSTTEDNNNFTDAQTGVNLLFSSDLGDYWGRLNYGFDWYHEDVNSTRERVNFATSPPTVTPLSSTQFPDDAWYSQYGVYLQWDVPLTDRLSAVSGVRYSLVEAGATVTAGNVTAPINPLYDAWTTSTGLNYALTDDWHLVGSVAEGFRAPNLDDLTANNSNIFQGTQIPNTELQAEQALSYEIGTKFDTPRFHAEAYVFWMDLRDNILRREVPDPSFVLQSENRNSRVRGFEMAGEYLLLDGWSVYGNFSTYYGQDLEENEPLSRIPPSQGVAGLRWREIDGSSWFDVYAWMVARQDRLSARDREDVIRIPPDGTPGFTTLNFRYGRMLSQRQRVSLNLENLLDKAYRVHGSGADGPGLNAIVSYELLH